MFLSSLLDWIFPHTCLLCQRGESLLCDQCQRSLPLQPQTIEVVGLERTLIATDYQQETVQALIKQFKYHNLPQLGQHLAPLLIQLVTLQAMDQDWILVPIPLHAKRLRERDYNQCQLLAEIIGKHFNWPVCSVLQRQRSTRAQAKLNKQQRLKNMAGAFSLSSTTILNNRNIILIDDVVTTGATLEAAAAVLRPLQPARIWGLALARNQSLRH